MPRSLIVIEIDVVNQNEGNFEDIQELLQETQLLPK
jgi:hypothetical protein